MTAKWPGSSWTIAPLPTARMVGAGSEEAEEAEETEEAEEAEEAKPLDNSLEARLEEPRLNQITNARRFSGT